MHTLSGEATLPFSFASPFSMQVNSYEWNFLLLKQILSLRRRSISWKSFAIQGNNKSCGRRSINPIALRKAKIVYNFGLSESNRVKVVYPFTLTVEQKCLHSQSGLEQTNLSVQVLHNLRQIFFFNGCNK